MAQHSTDWMALIIGYGSEIRRDDGIGPYVARKIHVRRLPGVRILTPHQLTPELAEDLSAAQVAIFVDAHIDALRDPVAIQRIVPGNATASMTHTCRPDALLELARRVFGRAPDAWSVAIAGEEFGVGEGLSRAGKNNADAAAEQIEAFLRSQM